MVSSVFFHVAGHRTGTTHFQHTLKRNQARLNSASIRFQKLHGVPEYRKTVVKLRRAIETGNTADAPALQAKVADISRMLLADCREETLFLSYEGQLGSLGLYRSKGLYPAHRALTEHLDRVFANENLTFCLSIRSYEDFVESTFKYLTKIGYSENFETYLSHLDPMAMSWVPIVEDLVSRRGAAKTRIWSFEAYIADMKAFYKWLVRDLLPPGTLPVKIKPAREQMNSSASAPALEITLQTNRLLGEIIKNAPLRRQAIEAVTRSVETVLDPATFGRPKLLSPEMRTTLRERYRRDLETIRALVPDTHFL